MQADEIQALTEARAKATALIVLCWNGAEAVGGVVVMRFGENPRDVIDRVKEKIDRLRPSLNGVEIMPVYDRTGLIEETIETLTGALREEVTITAIVILLFLMHVRDFLPDISDGPHGKHRL